MGSIPSFASSLRFDWKQIPNFVTLLEGPCKVVEIGFPGSQLLDALLEAGHDAFKVNIDSQEVEMVSQRANRCLNAGLKKVPFSDSSIDVVVITGIFERISIEQAHDFLKEIARFCKRSIIVQIDCGVQGAEELNPRQYWEELFFSRGFRRHPSYFSIQNYDSINWLDSSFLLAFENVSEQVPPNRDTSFLNRCDNESYYRHVKYSWLAGYVKPGDDVLDLTNNGIAGGSVLKELSFGSTFRAGNSMDSMAAEVAVVDLLITDFSTLLEMGQGRAASLLGSLVRPSGRLIILGDQSLTSISDETLNQLNGTLKSSGQWILEQVFGFSKQGQKTILSFESGDLASLNKQPAWFSWFRLSEIGKCEFQDKVYPYASPPGNLLGFSKFYDCGCIVREIVEVPFRIRGEALYERVLALIKMTRGDSADQGAALCVYLYGLLGGRKLPENIGWLKPRILTYLDIVSPNPHVHRWQVSLSYALGLLFEKVGETEEASFYFQRSISLGSKPFSPVLSTKIVAAYKRLASEKFSQGLRADGLKLLSEAQGEMWSAIVDPAEWLGKPEFPLPCTYFDMMGLIDDGMHSTVLLSYAKSGYFGRTKYWQMWSSGSYRQPLQKENEELHGREKNLFETQNELVSQLETLKRDFEMLSRRWRRSVGFEVNEDYSLIRKFLIKLTCRISRKLSGVEYQ